MLSQWNDEAVKLISAFGEAVAKLDTIDAGSAKSTLDAVAASVGIGAGKVLQALRLSITGAGGGPDLMMIMEIIGKNEVVNRINYALKTLSVKKP